MASDPTIHLAVVDDWEVRGDGSGDPRKIQFEPMRRLARLFNERGLRLCVNAEMMQQLTFRKWQKRFPELKELADEWDVVLRDTFLHGNDVQLHIHPQWSAATFADGRWRLEGDWSLLRNNREAVREMITAGIAYLEHLLRSHDSKYRCVSFRAGAHVIAPSDYILSLLAELGIVVDISVVPGIRYRTRRLECDYSSCEEEFLPYFPCMDDARKVAVGPQPIVCVPTNQFRPGLPFLVGRDMRKLVDKSKKVVHRRGDSKASVSSQTVRASTDWEYVESRLQRVLRRVQSHVAIVYVSDISQLDYAHLVRMLETIRRRARLSQLAQVPVVLASHTKDIKDFSAIAKFPDVLAAAPDMKTITLTELAEGLLNGTYPIRTQNELLRLRNAA